MRRAAARLRSRHGFSLAELLIVLVIFSLLGSAIGIGLAAAMRTYNDVRAVSEASVLCDTVAVELSDTLRSATAAFDNGSDAVFTSRRYGADVSVGTDGSGHITVGGSAILSDAVYTGLDASASVRYADGRFTLSIEVTRDGKTLAEAELLITPLNI